MSYALLTGDGFIHGAVKHGAKEWTYYDYRTGETHSTNSIEKLLASVQVQRPLDAHSDQPREAAALTAPSSAIGRTTASSGI
jgi:hypothetical protein